MAFDEAGDRQAAAQIDNFGARARLRGDLPIRPEGGDLAAGDGDGFGLGTGGVEGDDLAVGQDEVGGPGVRDDCQQNHPCAMPQFE